MNRKTIVKKKKKNLNIFQMKCMLNKRKKGYKKWEY